jgi:hypothetical protein
MVSDAEFVFVITARRENSWHETNGSNLKPFANQQAKAF